MLNNFIAAGKTSGMIIKMLQGIIVFSTSIISCETNTDPKKAYPTASLEVITIERSVLLITADEKNNPSPPPTLRVNTGGMILRARGAQFDKNLGKITLTLKAINPQCIWSEGYTTFTVPVVGPPSKVVEDRAPGQGILQLDFKIEEYVKDFVCSRNAGFRGIIEATVTVENIAGLRMSTPPVRISVGGAD